MRKEKGLFFATLKEAGVAGNVLDAIEGVDRKQFFDPVFGDRVWSMESLPIGLGQRSEEPVVLAKMLSLLEPNKKQRILEVGTGSGYSTALLSRLAESVVSVDYYEFLAKTARDRVREAGCRNVRFFAGDATDFEDDPGEFDAAVVFAGCLRTPYPILNLLKFDGILVFPMGPAHQQQIVRVVNRPNAERFADNFQFHDLCLFDSIRGRYGWIDSPTLPPDTDPVEKKPDTPSGKKADGK